MRLVILIILALAIFSQARLTKRCSAHLKKSGIVSTFIILKEQVDFTKLTNKKGKSVFRIENETARGKLVVRALKKLAKRTQRKLIKYLKRRRIKHRSYWITNAVAADGLKQKDIENIEKIVEVTIQDNDPINQEKEKKVQAPPVLTNATQSVWTFATRVWDEGCQGSGITIGVVDSGVFHVHPSLKLAYRGTKKKRNGKLKFNHNFNWYDATNCSQTEPTDDAELTFHGTHVTGVAVGGRAGSTNRYIGVAPKSKFIACRAFDGDNKFTVEGLTKCYQFMIAPHDRHGKRGDVRKRPHITNHSYQCTNCDQEDLEHSLNALHASGVAVVASAQNNGTGGNRGGCETVAWPPGNLRNVTTVGALQYRSNNIAFFSSKGPVRLSTGGFLLKPDISAPGSSIESAFGKDRFIRYSGTSQSSPIVAGALALFWEAVPYYRRKISESMGIIKGTSFKQRTGTCTSSSAVSPNNVFGFGTINIHFAIQIGRKLVGEMRTKCLEECEKFNDAKDTDGSAPVLDFHRNTLSEDLENSLETHELNTLGYYSPSKHFTVHPRKISKIIKRLKKHLPHPHIRRLINKLKKLRKRLRYKRCKRKCEVRFAPARCSAGKVNQPPLPEENQEITESEHVHIVGSLLQDC